MPGKFEALTELCLSQAQDLQRFVDSLPKEAWDVQSACGEWQVGDVIAHLAAASNLFGELIPAMTRSEAASNEWRIPNPSRQAEVAGDARALRQHLGDQGLRRYFRQGNDTFLRALQALQPEDADKTSPSVMGGRRTLYQVLGARLGEMAIHRWDMESRLKPDAGFPEKALQPLLGYLAGWRTFSFQKSAPHAPIHYRWDISVPAPSQWDLVLKGDSFEHARDSQARPDVLFHTDPVSYILISVGRLDLQQAVASGRVRAVGEKAAVAAYAPSFRNL